MRAEPMWFKSSYSASDGSQCLEVAAVRGAVRIRDSKRRSGPQLAITAHAWADFLAYAGEVA
ncbi:DUF397 domain-containing protein [Streptomyces orinoci]|uniref:DUF397 domain-containing protein n=2 Tax=Streptomyces orinoci TaxID=67339 RepID=A0ABV3K8M9_STRON|nr:DUF397 domain-containing protein [Streptomyces orinoci]